MSKTFLQRRSIIVSIAIALVFTFFIGYGIEVFDAGPEFEDFCPSRLYEITTEEACLEAGGSWNSENIRAPSPERGCSPSRECYDQYDTARDSHDRVVFIASIIIGILTIIGGVLLKKETISSGLLGGSILLILYGTIRYWRLADTILKFVLLGIALAVLLWLAYKKIER